MPEFKLSNAVKHFGTITEHKNEVCKGCFIAGLYWQGIIHDLSKFSLAEFIPSVKYYTGTSSPIIAEKDDRGYSLAWLHHRGRNPHHWEYWVDKLSRGGIALKIPVKFVTEMACDIIAAGKVYHKGEWNQHMPLAYISDKINKGDILLHEETAKLLLTILGEFAEKGYKALRKSNIRRIVTELSY
jgi:hypothetical protein